MPWTLHPWMSPRESEAGHSRNEGISGTGRTTLLVPLTRPPSFTNRYSVYIYIYIPSPSNRSPLEGCKALRGLFFCFEQYKHEPMGAIQSFLGQVGFHRRLFRFGGSTEPVCPLWSLMEHKRIVAKDLHLQTQWHTGNLVFLRIHLRLPSSCYKIYKCIAA